MSDSFASIKSAFVGLFGSNRKLSFGTAAQGHQRSHDMVKDVKIDKPVSTILNSDMELVTGNAQQTKKDEENFSTLSPKVEGKHLETPMPVATVAATEGTGGILNASMTSSGPVAVDTEKWDALVATAADYKPDFPGFDNLFESLRESEQLLNDYRERKKVSRINMTAPIASPRSIGSDIDDSEVAHAYLNLVKLHLALSDMWLQHDCTIPPFCIATAP